MFVIGYSKIFYCLWHFYFSSSVFEKLQMSILVFYFYYSFLSIYLLNSLKLSYVCTCVHTFVDAYCMFACASTCCMYLRRTGVRIFMWVLHMYVRAFLRSLVHAACMRMRWHVVRICACMGIRMYMWCLYFYCLPTR
jgi:hypothetical protein